VSKRSNPGAAEESAPLDPRECATARELAYRVDRSPATVTRWAEKHGLGRVVGRVWLISRPGIEMVIAGDNVTLDLYRRGKRSDPRVRAYFEALGLAELCKPARSARRPAQRAAD
jgi:hypothetical protein